MSCPYCEAPTNDFIQMNQNTIDYSCIEISINRQGILRARTYVRKDDLFLYEHQDIIEINYCPLCGKPFRKI